MRLLEVDLENDPIDIQAKAVRDALASEGFFVVKNSGIPQHVTDHMFNLSRRFFANPLSEKKSFAATQDECGYFAPFLQALESGKQDHKESWTYGRDCATKVQAMPHPFCDSSDTLDTLRQFYRACHDVSLRLLELFALALELPLDYFRANHSFGERTLCGLIRYPARTQQELKALGELDIRAGQHQDWGSLTMLFQETGGPQGLQLLLPEDTASAASEVELVAGKERKFKWYDAPPLPEGQFCVNIGMAMEYWTAGAYKATVHRVIFPAARAHTQDGTHAGAAEAVALPDRYSIAYFVSPNDGVRLVPIVAGPTRDGDGITAGELVDRELKRSITKHV